MVGGLSLLGAHSVPCACLADIGFNFFFKLWLSIFVDNTLS